MAEEAPSPAELQANLKEYEEQLEQVGALLLDDPHNQEYKTIYDDLSEIMLARQRAALGGQAPLEWAIGSSVRALYRGDGQWYAGTIVAVSAAGKLIVSYEGYEQPEELEREEVQLRGLDSEGGYTGVSAPKRPRATDDAVIEEMPAWLNIKPEDDEATKTKKRRLQKSYKSKQRFAKMDLETKEKANAWKSFVSGKGAKKKKGFMTGHKKGSMFAAPEGLEGRVGVVGSGKAMTDYTHARRHVFQPGQGDA